MSYYTLALSTMSHDASCAIFADDELLSFIQSERLERDKNSADITEKSKVWFDYVHKNYTKKIDLLIISSWWERQPRAEFIVNYIKENFTIDKLIYYNDYNSNAIVDPNKPQYQSHHCSHAHSAFYMSPFDEAVCLIIDALGSSYTLKTTHLSHIDEAFGVFGVESTSILEIDKNYKRNYLYKKSQYAPVRLVTLRNKFNETHDAPFFNFNGGLMNWAAPPEEENNIFKNISYKFDATVHMDIGSMYETVTRYLRMGRNGYGKVMGLSAYGNPNNTLPPFLMNDTILSNNNLFTTTREINHLVYPELRYDNLSFQDKANIAYEVQKSLEKVFLHHAEFIKNNSKIKNLVIGGGCALNILGVSAIKEKYPEFNIFVDPIANDATHAIGIGIHFYNLYKMKGQLEKTKKFHSIYTGPKYELEDMRKDIELFLEKLNDIN